MAPAFIGDAPAGVIAPALIGEAPIGVIAPADGIALAFIGDAPVGVIALAFSIGPGASSIEEAPPPARDTLGVGDGAPAKSRK
jgi:hypothetical protein